MTIRLSNELEARLKDEAARRGLAAEEYATKLILQHLPSPAQPDSLATLFERWRSEDPARTPEEVSMRDKEVEEFKEAMNRNRLDMEGPESRKLFP